MIDIIKLNDFGKVTENDTLSLNFSYITPSKNIGFLKMSINEQSVKFQNVFENSYLVIRIHRCKQGIRMLQYCET